MTFYTGKRSWWSFLGFPSVASILAFSLFLSVLVYPGGINSPAISFLSDFIVSKLVEIPEGANAEFGNMLISASSVIIGSLLSVIVSLGVYTFLHIHQDKKESRSLYETIRSIKEKLALAESDRDEYVRRVNEIKDHISKPSPQREKVDVALFGRLLSYAPLYVAKGCGYFDDEGLEVTFCTKGTDKAVAEALKQNQFPFGVADPISVFTTQENISEEKVKILLPLLKKLDLIPLVRKTVVELINDTSKPQPELLKIASYERPSTTYAAALHLKSDLEELFSSLKIKSKIKIETYKSDAEEFESPEKMKSLLADCDLLLLWSPVSSWMFSSQPPPGSEDFALLTVNNHICKFVSQPEHWSSRELSEIDNLEVSTIWHPLNARETGGYKVLATAVLTSEYVIKHRPELCRRFSRAICRALVRLEGTDWDGVESELKDDSKIWDSVESSIRTHGNSYVTVGALKRLVISNQSTSKGRSVYPFIDSLSKYDPKKYYMHLLHLENLWKKDESVQNEIPKISDDRGLEEYDKFFCVEQLRQNA